MLGGGREAAVSRPTAAGCSKQAKAKQVDSVDRIMAPPEALEETRSLTGGVWPRVP